MLLFLPYFCFSQESLNSRIFYRYPIFEEFKEEEKTGVGNKFLQSLFPFTFLLGSITLNVGMREGIYRNNYHNNWWGTVNGALTLGLAGTSFYVR